MYMWAGAAAGISDQCNRFPALDFFTALFQQLGTMSETGGHTMAVINDNDVSIKTSFAGKGHYAIGRSQDGSSLTGGNVISFMKFASTRKRRFDSRTWKSPMTLRPGIPDESREWKPAGFADPPEI